jgi:uncharacterized protein
MTPEERNLIENLFDRLRQADVNSKDPEAGQLIHAKTAALPSAPYLLTQAVIVQEHALTNAQVQIAELENRLAAATRIRIQTTSGAAVAPGNDTSSPGRSPGTS